MDTQTSGMMFYMERGCIMADRVTAFAPEQWNFFYWGEKIAYLRLRHGFLTLSCPDEDGKVIYEDDLSGAPCFDSDEQRIRYLTLSVEKIISANPALISQRKA